MQALLRSAQQHGARGLRCRHDEEHPFAALHLGVMLEHLAKAYLASLSPALLAEDKADFPTLVRLTGHGHRLNPGGSSPRTVSLDVALKRVGQLNDAPEFKALAEEMQPVRHARDGSAHMGYPGIDQDVIAQTAMRGTKALLTLLEITIDEFFGDYAPAAKALLDERVNAVHQRVALKKSRAQEHFAAQFGHFTGPRRREALAEIDVRTSADDDDRHVYGCPVCQQRGVLSGVSDIDVDVDTEIVDGEPSAWLVSATVYLRPNAFQCPFCGLTLHGHEELQTAGLPLRMDLREATDLDLEAAYSKELEAFENSGQG